MPSDTAAKPAYVPVAAARQLMRTARSATLATLDSATGHPFASLVTVATDPAGRPILLLSKLALHTRNLLQDARVSLLIDDRSASLNDDALAGRRLSLSGCIAPMPRAADAEFRRRFLARHPEAEGYAGFTDFDLYVLDPEIGHLVAGFGRINALSGYDLLLDLAGAELLIEAEAEIVSHMNADHRAAILHYATVLLGQPAADWQVVGSDPEGLDLAAFDTGRWLDARLVFPKPVHHLGPLRAMLKELASVQRID